MNKFFRITLLLPVALLGSAVLGICAEPAKPLRALLVTGGCCHDYNTQKSILTNGISARANVTWKVVHEGGESREHKVSIYNDKDWAKNFDVIVHNECFGAVTDDAFVENIAAAHHGGVAAVMLHCSTHSYRAAKTDEWRKCLGVSSYKHEKRRDLTIKNVNPTHPVMKGFPETWHNPDDELYMVEKFWPTAIALGDAYGQDTKKDHTCIWVNQYGKGRVFSTTLGHQNSTMQSEVYLDLVTRGLLWATGKLKDDGKPQAGYGPGGK